MSRLIIDHVLVLSDNYVWLIHDPRTGATAAVDPAEAEPVRQALVAKGWRLTHILNTHHHYDHTDGNEALKAAFGAKVIGFAGDADRLPGLTDPVREGDGFSFGDVTVNVLEVPGHTRGHIAYWIEGAAALFCGDTLFSLGCGRVLDDSTPEVLWHSLERLRRLPDLTMVYCAHEYTEANGRFALTIEPDNTALLDRMEDVVSLRAGGHPTVPSLLGVEKAANPFLRADLPAIAASLGLKGATPAAVFTEIRARKNAFRG